MDFAHSMGPKLQDQLAQGAITGENARAFARSLDSHLKVMRQIDRLIQVEYQRGKAAPKATEIPRLDAARPKP